MPFFIIYIGHDRDYMLAKHYNAFLLGVAATLFSTILNYKNFIDSIDYKCQIYVYKYQWTIL